MAYQRAVAGLDPPLKARAGVHVGPVILRENSQSDVARGAKPLEEEGTAKAVAARVMSIANGGQTLLSADARNALGEIILRVESHGHWRMKGIAEPMELFEVGEADTLFMPPPDAVKGYRVVRDGDVWLPTRNIKHSLPAELDSFVGRRETLAELARRLDAGARLVSVLGIGGTGKTRLVTRFGWSWLGDFPGGVWFCDLSQARSLDGIVYSVAEALAVPLGKEDPLTQLGNAIAARRIAELGDRFLLAQRNGERLGDGVDDADQASGLRQIAEPDAAGEVSEPAPTEPRDQPRLARAADPQHRHEARAGVEAARQFGQRLATADEGIELCGQTVLDVPRRQPDVALAHHAIALRCIGGRGKRRIGFADLEQLHRLCNALHAPVTVRLDAQRDVPQGVSRVGGEKRLPPARDRHHARRQRLRRTLDLERLGAARHVRGAVLAQDHGSDMHSGTRLQRWIQRGKGVLVRHRVGNRVGGRLEQQQHAVGLVDFASAPGREEISGEAIVSGPQRVQFGLTQPLRQLGAVAHVGQEQRSNLAHSDTIPKF